MIRQMHDRQCIIDIVTRYAASLDRRQWDDLADCFADEVSLHLVSTGEWRTFTRQDIIDYASRTFAYYDATQHVSANHQISVSGDEAVCISTLNATHYRAGEPGGSTQRQLGYYRYEFARTPEWKIVRMQQELGWEEGNQALFDRAHEARDALPAS
jgi:3-phenylpropionate/cinnamic acid dioxygenase small subunit